MSVFTPWINVLDVQSQLSRQLWTQLLVHSLRPSQDDECVVLCDKCIYGWFFTALLSRLKTRFTKQPQKQVSLLFLLVLWSVFFLNRWRKCNTKAEFIHYKVVKLPSPHPLFLSPFFILFSFLFHPSLLELSSLFSLLSVICSSLFTFFFDFLCDVSASPSFQLFLFFPRLLFSCSFILSFSIL